MRWQIVDHLSLQHQAAHRSLENTTLWQRDMSCKAGTKVKIRSGCADDITSKTKCHTHPRGMADIRTSTTSERVLGNENTITKGEGSREGNEQNGDFRSRRHKRTT